jgi:Domain of unknown function (DUF6901)
VSEEKPTIRINYRFGFAGGSSREFTLELDRNSLAARPQPRSEWPPWTRLSYRQCPNCPLKEQQHPHCPVAVNMVGVVETFSATQSLDEVEVVVEAAERLYSKRTTVEEALSSLIGTITVTSGCPVLDLLRPMVDTHLPFMSAEESIYRTISMYLVAQFLRMRRGLHPDWAMHDFLKVLEAARTTNVALCRRLQSLGIGDATLNGLARLNTFGELTSLSIEQDLGRLEKIFEGHYRQ